MRARPALVVLGLIAVVAVTTTGVTLAAFSRTAQNAGSTFAAASEFSTCPNQTLTPSFMTGFEMGRRSAGGYNNITIFNPAIVDGSVERSGEYSMRLAPTSGTPQYAQWTNVAGGTTTQVVRFALRFTTLPTGDVGQLLHMNGGGGLQLRFTAATKKLAIATRANTSSAWTVTPAHTALTAGTWHVVEVRFRVAAPNHIADWRLDGAPQPSASVAAAGATTTQTTFGTGPTGTTDSYTAWYDDVVISHDSTHYPLGDGRIYGIWPDGVGASNDPSNVIKDHAGNPLGPAAWDLLNEVPMTGMTDFVQQTAVNTSAYAEFTFGDTTQTCIRAARAYWVTHSTATNGTNHVRVSVHDGTQTTVLLDGSSLANNVNPRDDSKTLTPQTTWTQSAVNGLRLRFGNSSNVSESPKIDSAMVEYEVPQ